MKLAFMVICFIASTYCAITEIMAGGGRAEISDILCITLSSIPMSAEFATVQHNADMETSR
jgi:hypothetical protein